MQSIYFELNIPKILATKLLSKFTQAVYFSPISPVRFGKIPEQVLPGPNWVRVAPILAGICGVDLSLFFVQADPSISITALPGAPKTFMGHELVGRVIETGSNVKSLKAGDRVTLQKYLPCCSIKEIDPPCRFCAQGNYTLCENIAEPPVYENLGVGFGDVFLAHKTQLIKVPDDIPDEEAVMIEPASVSLHAVLRRPPLDDEKVLVIGAGTIGLNVIQCAKAVNPRCKIHVLEKISFKKDLARKLGADEILSGDPYEAVAKATGGKLYQGAFKNRNILGGFDLIYDCVGYSSTIQDSLRWLRAWGHYVMVGNQLSPVHFDQTPIWNQEVNIIGVNAHGCEDHNGENISSFDLAIRMIREGKIDLKGLVTHRFALKDYKEAFKMFRKKDEPVIKVVFEMK
jgi:threonine dehydrogenase-like Zn-dependent dehydrogenase